MQGFYILSFHVSPSRVEFFSDASHEQTSTLSSIYIGDAETSSSMAAYLLPFGISDKPCQQ